MTLVVGITHHEPWADEAQAWLLSRDLSYRYLVFHQIAITRSGNFAVANRVFPQQDRSLRSLGYIPVHVSKGSMFFEGREVEPTDFIIYRLS